MPRSLRGPRSATNAWVGRLTDAELDYGDDAVPFGRAACSSATTTAPSPIAAPTRLTDPERTSPIAKTPRTLVSRGSRRPDPLFARWTLDGTSGPVKMNFLASKTTALCSSQVVAGSAPMKRNTCRIGFSVSSPVTLLRQRTRSSCFSRVPCKATISVRVNTSILSVASRRSIRYCDMLSARLGPRTSIQIFAAKLRRKIAACPAELPPPTRTISSLRHRRLDRRSPIPNSAPLEVPQVRDVEATVASAGRNDRCRGPDAPAIAQVKYG